MKEKYRIIEIANIKVFEKKPSKICDCVKLFEFKGKKRMVI
jgi:hypothetical protein